MALSRYEILDEFTREELRCEYNSRGPRGRIRLLRKLIPKVRLDKQIRDLAIGEDNTEVRVWTAKHFYLSQEERDRLQLDADEFVRAALWENPSGIRRNTRYLKEELDWIDWFKAATPLERLAMMRNPEVAPRFVEIIFDPEDIELGVGIEIRRELALALLSNVGAIQSYPLSYSEWKERVGEDAWANDYLEMTKGDLEHRVRLWELAAKWPSQSGIPHSVYRHASIDAETKLRIYKGCEDSILRQAILENDLPELDEHGGRSFRPSKVLEIGKDDSDEWCRKIAVRRSPAKVDPESKGAIALSVGWHTTMNLCIVAIAFGIFDGATTQFETVSFAILILFFALTNMRWTIRTNHSWEGKLDEAAQYTRLLELLKDPQLTDKLKLEVEWSIAQARHELKKSERKSAIYFFGWSVVGLLALYQILHVVLALTPFGIRF